jgi:membrane-associated phospholipid phosphatase
LFGPQVMVLAVLVALLAWARTELGDHTLSQVLTGAVIGAVVGGSAFAVAMTVLQTFSR